MSPQCSKCLSGCVCGVKNLPELLKARHESLVGWMQVSAQDTDDQMSPRDATDLATERDGMAAAVPEVSCPGLISRSQSALSEEAVSRSAMEPPTLLTAKAASPSRSQGGKLCSPRSDGVEGPDGSQDGKLCSPGYDAVKGPDGPDGSLSAMTTAATGFAIEEAFSPPDGRSFGCCVAGAPGSGDDSDWMWDTSLAVGAAALSGGKQVATFLGHQIYEAAVFAQPHVQSMADSAATALKSAAEDGMEKIRALGPRRSKLERARASMALQPPQLEKPALPSLPELGAYAAHMGFNPAAYATLPAMPPVQLGAYSRPLVQGVQPGYATHNLAGQPGQPGQPGQLQPSYSFVRTSLPDSQPSVMRQTSSPPLMRQGSSFILHKTPSRHSLGGRAPLAPTPIISAEAKAAQ